MVERNIKDNLYQICYEAGLIGLKWFRQGPQVRKKDDASPVTIADKKIEEFIRRNLEEQFPQSNLYGEELGWTRRTVGETTWVIDPIDGTKSFVAGNPLWGTLIGRVDAAGLADIGSIYIPFTGEHWIAHGEEPTFLNGRVCSTSSIKKLEDAVVATTSATDLSNEGWEAFRGIADRASIVRFGGDCYIYALLASGHVDVVIETNLQSYDYMPMVRIVENAGGVITDWNGGSLSLQSTGNVVAASTPDLHETILNILDPIA